MYRETETDESQQGIDIPYERLNSETLQRMIEEFVTRDGSNWDDFGGGLETKVAQVMAQLKQKKIKVIFDQQSQSANLVMC